jgi:hypothetical protein
MSIEHLIRRTGLLSLIAAVLIFVSQFVGLSAYTSDLSLNELVKSLPATLYNTLKLAGFILLLPGLVGLYVRQSGAGGSLGWISFLLAFLGTAFVIGDWWYEAFVVPWLANVAPQALRIPPSGSLRAGAMTGFFLFAAGWFLFGIASFRAQVFPRWASIVVIIGGVLGFLAGYPPFLIVLALGVGWMGYWLQKHNDVMKTGETAEIYLEVERQR